MASNEMTLMSKLVNKIHQTSDAEPFRDPVEWKALGLYDYPKIIKNPMDLNQILKKIKEGRYGSIQEAAEDVRLIWKNCMTYNADGSDFYHLAQSMSKRFEDKYTKLLKEVGMSDSTTHHPKNPSGPTLDEKRAFAKSLYKIGKEDLGKIITDLDAKCPEALTKNAAEDEVEINVDNISPTVFQELITFVTSVSDSSRKKKGSSLTNKAKKSKS